MSRAVNPTAAEFLGSHAAFAIREYLRAEDALHAATVAFVRAETTENLVALDDARCAVRDAERALANEIAVRCTHVVVESITVKSYER